MKSKIIQPTLEVLKNRTVVLFIISLAVIDIICSVIVLSQVSPSDITVYARYTAFGQVHFYKDHWQYLILFAGFLTTVAIVHGMLIVKLYMLEKYSTAKAMGWYAVVVMLIATVYALGVLSLGRAA